MSDGSDSSGPVMSLSDIDEDFDKAMLVLSQGKKDGKPKFCETWQSESSSASSSRPSSALEIEKDIIKHKETLCFVCNTTFRTQLEQKLCKCLETVEAEKIADEKAPSCRSVPISKQIMKECNLSPELEPDDSPCHPFNDPPLSQAFLSHFDDGLLTAMDQAWTTYHEQREREEPANWKFVHELPQNYFDCVRTYFLLLKLSFYARVCLIITCDYITETFPLENGGFQIDKASAAAAIPAAKPGTSNQVSRPVTAICFFCQVTFTINSLRNLSRFCGKSDCCEHRLRHLCRFDECSMEFINILVKLKPNFVDLYNQIAARNPE